MTWTTDPPKAAGWYWMRFEDYRDDPQPKHVWMSAPDGIGGPVLCAVFGNPEFGGDPIADRTDVEWWSIPIGEPTA